ncbi:MAG: ATP-dependent RecD-like DNA helicase, partial [Desulfovibrio sp.]|nr:ATP-dependent RecD-like DNA helicase [Desulfovibrio sp.]
MVFLQGHGVPASISLRIWRQYGAGAMGLLRNEPHRLAWDVRGIGFATADQIAAKIGITQDHPTRLQAGLLHSLSQAGEEGHVCLPRAELLSKASHILRVDTELLEPSLQVLLDSSRLIAEPDEPGHPIYLAGLHMLETSAARDLAALARKPGLLTPARAAKAVAWVSDQLKVSPSPAQAQALTQVLASGLAVLTGGPGTGKTTLVRAVLAIAQRMGHQVLLAAPTGRAAKRMQEMTDLEASTIHRLLEYSPKEGKFQRHASRPLEADLLVVDESSMIDTWLAAHLFQALGPRTRLLLVGDANQLPSVGPGLVLKQVMQSGAGVVAELTEIFRQDQAGLIVTNAHRVLQGQMPLLPQAGEGDFFFIEEPDPARVPDLVRRL